MGADHSVDKIVFFDGVCNLCNASVQFLIRHNTKNNLRFAPLQSEVARNILLNYPEVARVDSILYLSDQGLYLKSEAILELLQELNGIYPYLVFFKLIPKFFRDYVYDFIARKRYRWFGKQEACWLPTAELKERFIS